MDIAADTAAGITAGVTAGIAADIAADMTVDIPVEIRGDISVLLRQAAACRGSACGAPRLATDIYFRGYPRKSQMLYSTVPMGCLRVAHGWVVGDNSWVGGDIPWDGHGLVVITATAHRWPMGCAWVVGGYSRRVPHG